MDNDVLVAKINESLETKFDEFTKGNLDPIKETADANKEKLDEMLKKIEGFEKERETRIGKTTEENLVHFKQILGEELKKLYRGEKTVVTLSDIPGTIPEAWINEVFYIPDDYGAFLASNPRTGPMAEVVNMAKKHESTNVSLTWKSQGSGEGIETGVTEGKTSAATVSPDRLIATVPLSNESQKYSALKLVEYFSQRLREEYNGEIDNQFFNGNTDPFVGLGNASGINTVTFGAGETAFANIDRKYLIRAIHSISSKAYGSSFWYINNSVVGTIQENLVDDNNRPIFNYDRDSLLGFKVLKSDKLNSTDDADKVVGYFGSSKIGVVYAIDGIEFAVSPHAEFSKDNVVLRCTADVIIYIVLPAAFCVIKTAAV